MKQFSVVASFAFALLSPLFPESVSAAIVEISIPIGSTEGQTYVSVDNAWSVNASSGTLDTHSGIGYLVNQDPVIPYTYTLHDHHYIASNIPDPTRATVTFAFDRPTAVNSISIIQHHNGISEVEGFFGDNVGAMTSLGAVFGPDGDVTGVSHFTELEPYTFDFGNSTHFGTVFQFVIRKTTLSDGYALYRSFLFDAGGAAIEPAQAVLSLPSSLWLILAAVPGVFATRRAGARSDRDRCRTSCSVDPSSTAAERSPGAASKCRG